MKPKPLDLEEMWQIIEDVFTKHYEERVCDVSNVDLKREYKQCYCDVLLEDLRNRRDEAKQCIESAVQGLMREIKHLEQDDGVIVTDFEEISEIIKKWFPDVVEDEQD